MNEEKKVISTKDLGGERGHRIYNGQPFTGVEVDYYHHVGMHEETEYKNGKKDGRYAWYDVYGKVGSEINYKNGKMDGLYIYWDENGNQKKEQYFKDDKEHGSYISWYENGQKEIDANYKDGELDGSYISWYENGKKKLEQNYKSGTLDGVSTWWHENGNKQCEINYINGERDGILTGWNEFGHRVNKKHYKKDVLQESLWKEVLENQSYFVFGLLVVLNIFIDIIAPPLSGEFTLAPKSITHFVFLIPSLLYGGLLQMEYVIWKPWMFNLPKDTERGYEPNKSDYLNLWRSHKGQIIGITFLFIINSFAMYLLTYPVFYRIVQMF